jgi:hypothetical protein
MTNSHYAFPLNSGDTGILSWQISIGPGLIRTSFPSKTAFSLANWIPSKCVEICGNPNFLFNSSIVQLSIFDDKSLNIQFLVSKSPFLMLRIPWSFQSQVSLCVSILCGTQLLPDGFWPTLLVPWRFPILGGGKLWRNCCFPQWRKTQPHKLRQEWAANGMAAWPLGVCSFWGENLLNPKVRLCPNPKVVFRCSFFGFCGPLW